MRTFFHGLNWHLSRQRSIPPFIAWAREHAIPFELQESGDDEQQTFARLDPLLAQKRIVYLGEEDHWIHEKNEVRLLLLRYLFSRGWRYIGEELGYSDGLRIDHYLETGDEAALGRIATYGYQGALRTDRDDTPTGILQEGHDRYPVRAFAEEQLRLTKALRALQEQQAPGSPRLHFFGYDLDALAGGGYEDLATLLQPYHAEPVIAAVNARVAGETVEQEITRLQQAEEFLLAQQAVLQNLLGPDDAQRLTHWTRTLRDSFAFIQLAHPATTLASLSEAMAAREKAMVRHVTTVLSHMKPEEKLVLMGHNRHLAKASSRIKQAGSALPGGGRVPSLGTTLNQLFPDQVFAIWMLHDHGTSSQPFGNLSNQYVSKRGSLNALLAEVGAYYLLPTQANDLRTHLLSREMEIIGIYNLPFRASIAQQADALFFVRRVSPLGPRGSRADP
jgi:erythromycin esterase-like protein